MTTVKTARTLHHYYPYQTAPDGVSVLGADSGEHQTTLPGISVFA